MIRLPAAAPSPVLEPRPSGRVHLQCPIDGGTSWWDTQPHGTCWCCDQPGVPYRRQFTKRDPEPYRTRYEA